MKLILSILASVLLGKFAPLWICKSVITFSEIFGSFLQFLIPLMILTFVTIGISNLSNKIGKLLLITLFISLISTFTAGFVSFFTSISLFPYFISNESIHLQNEINMNISPFFTLSFSQILDTTSSIILAFILGYHLAKMKINNENSYLYNVMRELELIIKNVLIKVIVPLLPIYVCGTFIKIIHSGRTFMILNIFWKVFLVVIILHYCFIFIQFLIAGIISGKNPFRMIYNQMSAYLTALGTQSSVATIPENINCAHKNQVSEDISNFVIPLCANIHMCGSIITITSCAMAICFMFNISISLASISSFIFTLSFVMIASPGIAGGSIMAALPFLNILFGNELGNSNSELCSMMIALYIAQDSFGTACNISGDNAICVIIDSISKKQK